MALAPLQPEVAQGLSILQQFDAEIDMAKDPRQQRLMVGQGAIETKETKLKATHDLTGAKEAEAASAAAEVEVVASQAVVAGATQEEQAALEARSLLVSVISC